MISTNHWYRGTADEALALYEQAFRDTAVVSRARYPEAGLPDFLAPLAGTTMQIELDIHGVRLGMTNAGPEYSPCPAISMLLNFDPSMIPDAREYLDQAWAVLSEGGEVRMPLGEYPHSAHYGWVQDRFGVNWQLMLTNPSGDPAPFMTPNVLFTEPVLWRAGEALEAWVAAVSGSRVLHRHPYPEGSAAPEGAVMFADAEVAGSLLSVMDSGPGHSFEFTPGSSFVIHCPDQETIDAAWEALSADPEAEQCGWLRDRFGVSWQVVPADMEQILAHEGAHERLMGMKRIVIADLLG